MHPYVNIAIQAARKAGTIALNGVDNLHKIKISEKSPFDYVTNVDKAVENSIIQAINKAYPEHAILGEESGKIDPNNAETVWIIDPIDGTNNFIKGIPQFAISIAIQIKGVIEHGVVYDPIKHEIFAASRGRGAQLNGKRIRVSGSSKLKTAMISTSTHPGSDLDQANVYFNVMKKVASNCLDIRITGSAALDLAYVACGRLDAYYYNDLKVWDMAAASLFVEEAGGYVSDFAGDNTYLEKGEVVAASPKIHAALLDIIAKSS